MIKVFKDLNTLKQFRSFAKLQILFPYNLNCPYLSSLFVSAFSHIAYTTSQNVSNLVMIFEFVFVRQVELFSLNLNFVPIRSIEITPLP